MTKEFILFLLAQAVSSLGSSAAADGLKVIWQARGLPAAQLGAVISLPAFPMIFIGPLVATIVERARLKRTLIISNIFLGFISLGIYTLFGRSTGGLIAGLTALFFLKALGQSVFEGGYTRAFKALAPQEGDEKDQAISWQSGVNNLGQAIGAACGAALAAEVGSAVFAVDAGSFVIAAFLVTLLPLGAAPAPAAPGSLHPRQLAQDVWVAIRYVLIRPRLVRVYALFVPLTLCFSAWDIASVFLLPKLGAPLAAFGSVGFVFLGAEIAAAALIAATKTRLTINLVLAAVVLLSVSTTFVWFLPMGTFGWLLAIRAVTGVASVTAGMGTNKILVLDAPKAMVARMAALVSSIGLGIIFGVNRIGVGILVDLVGAASTFAVVGLTATATALAICMLQVRAQIIVKTRRLLLARDVFVICESNQKVVAFRYLLSEMAD